MWSKYKIPLISIFFVLFVDQFIKLYIKMHYPLGEIGRLGNGAILYFTENPGMAFGFEFGGQAGKLTLSIFRIIACIGGAWYISHIVKNKEHKGFIFAVSLILAGAIGNILDSAFYGLIFDRGTTLEPHFGIYEAYDGIAQLTTHGYAPAMFGCVVDMFYFPLINGTFPDWFPIWGGEDFQFFRPIFNFADFSISTGVVTIILFQKKFTQQHHEAEAQTETSAENLDTNASSNLNKEQA